MSPARLRLHTGIIGLVLAALMTCGAVPSTADRSAVEWLRKNARPFQAVPEPIPVGQHYDTLICFDHTTPSTPRP